MFGTFIPCRNFSAKPNPFWTYCKCNTVLSLCCKRDWDTRIMAGSMCLVLVSFFYVCLTVWLYIKVLIKIHSSQCGFALCTLPLKRSKDWDSHWRGTLSGCDREPKFRWRTSCKNLINPTREHICHENLAVDTFKYLKVEIWRKCSHIWKLNCALLLTTPIESSVT